MAKKVKLVKRHAKAARKARAKRARSNAARDSPHRLTDIMHNLYFSREERLMEKEKENEANIKALSRYVEKHLEKRIDWVQKELEKSLAAMQRDYEKKIERMENSIAAINKLVEELRKENESLRADRQYFITSLKNIMVSQGIAPEAPEEAEAIKPRMSNVAENSKIKTSLDTLLEMIAEKKSVKITDAAKKLRVSEKQIEEWAKLLEEHGLIDIHYPTFGKPVLKKRSVE